MKLHKIKFSIYQCIWNRKRYIIVADVYVDHPGRIPIYHKKTLYEFKIFTFDILEQICLLLNISEEQYLSKAREYNAEIKYDKYLRKNTCLFISKAEAKKFIKDYLNTLLALVYISNDELDIEYIHNYK